MAELGEKTLHSQVIYRGKILNLRVDRVLLPNGTEGLREVVEHAGAVAVVALTEEGEVVMVRQYRYAVGRHLLEIPAGKLEEGEDPLQCAKRELAEETGYTARRWEPLLSFYSTPGFSSEKMHLFLARGLERGGQAPDEDEFLQVVKVPLAEALGMLWRGEICDAKSAAGLLAASWLLAREGRQEDHPPLP
ncbi:NUDIX hydrolase [Desulfovirgula thermocuniculi]|uniref:NUDIX hydrolase n=1 Tax=Desulfovirgula thermocuniculi TaxID=348842 RepID=UPI0004894FAD|nr:NUDIX hydrolase [Desulfovirgula thermocuniculi]